MKALVYDAAESLSICDRPMPEPKPGELLINVKAAGICGSDMHAYLGHDERRPAPLILGHEAAGVVETGAQAGRRVAINPLVGCGACLACQTGRENICPDRQIISLPPREGAFAQFVALPEQNLVTVPGNIPFHVAALAEPMAVSWHAVRLGMAALHGSFDHGALVIGGGAIGLAAALVLRAKGFETVTIVEPNPARRAYLSDHSDCRVAAAADGQYPLVLDAVGFAATRAVASAHTLPGGVIVHVGLGEDSGGIDARRLTLQEITFIGTYTYTAKDYRDTAEAMFSGDLGALDWTEMRPLDHGPAAFRDIRAGTVDAPKIILDPWA